MCVLVCVCGGGAALLVCVEGDIHLVTKLGKKMKKEVKTLSGYSVGSSLIFCLLPLIYPASHQQKIPCMTWS